MSIRPIIINHGEVRKGDTKMSLLTITAEYDSLDTMRNTREDLVGTGIEQEHIYVDEEKHLVKVAVPTAIESEITEILNRHQPTALYETKR